VFKTSEKSGIITAFINCYIIFTCWQWMGLKGNLWEPQERARFEKRGERNCFLAGLIPKSVLPLGRLLHHSW
jgi:hypothetical protein